MKRMKFPNIFRRTASSSTSAPPPPERALPYSRLTLDDWRSSPERVAFVAELMRQPLFLDLVGMLSNLRPIHRGTVDATTAAMLLGQRTGHDQVIASLLSAGSIPAAPLQELPPADYDAQNLMAAWDKEGDMSDTQ